MPTTTRFDSSTYSIADHEEGDHDGEDNDDLHDEQFQDEVLSPPGMDLEAIFFTGRGGER